MALVRKKIDYTPLLCNEKSNYFDRSDEYTINGLNLRMCLIFEVFCFISENYKSKGIIVPTIKGSKYE